MPEAFLRLDRPELQDGLLVLRTVPAELRESRRVGHTAPLAYLYEKPTEFEPTSDMALTAGHYDEANLVWSFSGEVSGITGLTESTTAVG